MKIDIKTYNRLITLNDLGINVDPKVIELRDFLNDRLYNLNQYTHQSHPDIIFYGKSKSDIVYSYGFRQVSLNNTFTKKLFEYFNISERLYIELIIFNQRILFPSDNMIINHDSKNYANLETNEIYYYKELQNII